MCIVSHTAHSQHTISKPPKYCTNSRINFWLLCRHIRQRFSSFFPFARPSCSFVLFSHSVGVLIFPSITLLLYNIALIFRMKLFVYSVSTLNVVVVVVIVLASHLHSFSGRDPSCVCASCFSRFSFFFCVSKIGPIIACWCANKVIKYAQFVYKPHKSERELCAFSY